MVRLQKGKDKGGIVEMSYIDIEDTRIFRILLISLTNECPEVGGYCGYCGGKGNQDQVLKHTIDCVWDNAASVLKEMKFKKTDKERKWWKEVTKGV